MMVNKFAILHLSIPAESAIIRSGNDVLVGRAAMNILELLREPLVHELILVLELCDFHLCISIYRFQAIQMLFINTITHTNNKDVNVCVVISLCDVTWTLGINCRITIRDEDQVIRSVRICMVQDIV